MRSMLIALSFTAMLFATSPLAAQGTTAGVLRDQMGGTVPSADVSSIDTGHPVTADGNITNAAVRWLTDNACNDEIKIRVFRPSFNGIGSLTLVGTAGPFNAVNGLNLLSFPAIAVQKGDLIGVVQLLSNCGGVTFSVTSHTGDTVYQIGTDFTGGSLAGSQARPGYDLDLAVSNGPTRLVGVLPVVGSAAGAFGAFFRTSVAITNVSGYPATITLVFHPAGVAASASDPSRTIALQPRNTINYDDVVATMGQSGLGSLDILSNAYEPVVTARVFNDLGATGTSGFTEEVVNPRDALQLQSYGHAHIAADLTNFRINIGVRTFDTPATIAVAVIDSTGHTVGSTVQHTYPANYFEQVALTSFVNGIALPPGGYIQVYSQAGPAVIYASTTDNRTNDGSLKLILAH